MCAVLCVCVCVGACMCMHACTSLHIRATFDQDIRALAQLVQVMISTISYYYTQPAQAASLTVTSKLFTVYLANNVCVSDSRDVKKSPVK